MLRRTKAWPAADAWDSQQREDEKNRRMRALMDSIVPARWRAGATHTPDAWTPPAIELKTPGRVDNAIRESARGEECQVRIPGVCRGGTDHTIWSHAATGAGGKGLSLKALDLCGAYCCTACDAVFDGQAKLPPGINRADVMCDWLHGHLRSLVILRQKGLV